MYNLLIDYELKIAELSGYGMQRKKKKKNLTADNDIARLKLHRKLLKTNLKWMKTANKKQWQKYELEVQSSFKKAKKAFSKLSEPSD